MSVTEHIKNIYEGPFKQYLRVSEKIGGVVQEQSKSVDILFQLQINLSSIIQKYKKPDNEQDENIFLDPIFIQIKKIKKVKINNPSSIYITHLNIINETVDIFAWAKETNVEEFLKQIKTNATPHLNKLKNALLRLDIKHVDWIYTWNKWYENLSTTLGKFYKDGLIWSGTEKLPVYLMGDITQVYGRLGHLKLFQEINQGENITRILRSIDVNTEEVEEGQDQSTSNTDDMNNQF